MTTAASIGYGTLFQDGNDASPETFTPLVGIEVTGVTPPQPTRDSIDVSHELSPDSAREFIAGLTDWGEAQIEFNYVPAATGLATLYAELSTAASSATKTRRIYYPDGSTFQFEAFLTNISPESPLDGKMSATATFKVSGPGYLTQA